MCELSAIKLHVFFRQQELILVYLGLIRLAYDATSPFCCWVASKGDLGAWIGLKLAGEQLVKVVFVSEDKSG